MNPGIHILLIVLGEVNNNVSNSDNKYYKLYISAKTGFGLDLLKNALISTQKDLTLDSGQTVVTNSRHYEALRNAAAALEKVRISLSSGITPDLLAEDLREAINHLGAITGEVTPDEVLGEIFGRFCIGK